MKYKIYYQKENKLKIAIVKNLLSEELPQNIIKITEIKQWYHYIEFKRLPYLHIVNLFKEMSIILETGLTLSQSIDILLKSDNPKPINEILVTIKFALQNAQPIHLALLKHEKYLKELPILFFKLAFKNGNLKDSIKALSIILIENEIAKDKFIDALRYPLVLIISLVSSISIIFSFVLPKFEYIFNQFGDKLPFATKSLLLVKNFLDNYSILILIIIVSFIMSFKYIYLIKRPSIDKLLILKIPLISKLYQNFIFYRLFLSLSMLINSKYTFQIALENTTNIVDNHFILFHIHNIINKIKNGHSISDAFSNTHLFDPLVIRLLLTAQETNNLKLVLTTITDMYKKKLDENIKLFASAISPIFIIMIATIILWIVFAIMLPIWELNNVLY